MTYEELDVVLVDLDGDSDKATGFGFVPDFDFGEPEAVGAGPLPMGLA